MRFLEKDLEQIIYETDSDSLAERGLQLEGKRYRQLRIGDYGISDIITHEKPRYCTKSKKHYKGLITVYELKKNKISVSAFFQGLGYVKGVQHYMNLKGFNIRNYNFELVLIGDELDLLSTISYLPELTYKQIDYNISSRPILNISFYTYKYGLDGLDFTQESGYSLGDNAFKL